MIYSFSYTQLHCQKNSQVNEDAVLVGNFGGYQIQKNIANYLQKIK